MDITIPKGTYKTEIKEVEVLNPSESDYFGLKLLFEIQKGRYKGLYFEVHYMLETGKDYTEAKQIHNERFERQKDAIVDLLEQTQANGSANENILQSAEEQLNDIYEQAEDEYAKLLDFIMLVKDLNIGIRKKHLYGLEHNWETPYIQQNLQLLQGKKYIVHLQKGITNSGIISYGRFFRIIKEQIPWSCLLWTFIIAVIAILIYIGSKQNL